MPSFSEVGFFADFRHDAVTHMTHISLLGHTRAHGGL